ncbi:MAG: GAF domain-containing protein [Candidatus Omnitrophica bacterium]|nr:GAF domain-containing protein [Candidatus Omnitrophota bacterium]
MKNNTTKNIKDVFLSAVIASETFKTMIALFDETLNRPHWWIIEKDAGVFVSPFCNTSLVECSYVKRPKKDARLCKKIILEKIRGLSEKEKHLITFRCHKKQVGIIIPLEVEFRRIGFMCACPIKKDTPSIDSILSLIAAHIKTGIENIKKEVELKKLYDSVRPRALALSTIHTVHRLMGSAVDLNDLLPRLSRLCLQVFRATYCSIMIIDNEKKMLYPKALVNLERAAKPKKIKIGEGIAGKVAQTEKAILKRNVLSVPLIDEELIGVITIRDKQNNEAFTGADQEVLETLAEQSVIAIHSARMYEEQENLTLGSIKSIAAALDIKGTSEYRRSEQFPKLVRTIGEELGLSYIDLRHLYYASLLPETDKFVIPEEILTKSSPLKKSEYDIIRKHPVRGAQIIEPLGILQPVIPIIMYHHEKYDGTGYPEGLKGDKIPIGARILCLAEAFEVLFRKTPYRQRTASLKSAVDEIKKNSGTQFDPKIVKAFYSAYKKGKLRSYLDGLKNEKK